MISDFDVGDALSNGLDDSGSLVTENDGKGSLGVLSRESIGI